jgi:hypothetical protein
MENNLRTNLSYISIPFWGKNLSSGLFLSCLRKKFSVVPSPVLERKMTANLYFKKKNENKEER